jgi:hypothetical protein
MVDALLPVECRERSARGKLFIDSEIDGEEKFVSVVALGARQQGNPVDGQSKLFSLSEIPSKQLISCMTQIISFPLSAIRFRVFDMTIAHDQQVHGET